MPICIETPNWLIATFPITVPLALMLLVGLWYKFDIGYRMAGVPSPTAALRTRNPPPPANVKRPKAPPGPPGAGSSPLLDSFWYKMKIAGASDSYAAWWERATAYHGERLHGIVEARKIILQAFSRGAISREELVHLAEAAPGMVPKVVLQSWLRTKLKHVTFRTFEMTAKSAPDGAKVSPEDMLGRSSGPPGDE